MRQIMDACKSEKVDAFIILEYLLTTLPTAQPTMGRSCDLKLLHYLKIALINRTIYLNIVYTNINPTLALKTKVNFNFM